MKTLISLILSILSIVISIFMIILFCKKVSSSSVVDTGTFIGVAAALIGISVTLIIGYQIYNAMEVKQKLTDIDELNKRLQEELKQTTNKFIKLEDSSNEGTYIIRAQMCADESSKDKALVYFMKAIKYSLSNVEYERRDGYTWLVDELERYTDLLDSAMFAGGDMSQVQARVDNYKSLIDAEIIVIRDHPKYYSIKKEFEKFLEDFYARMEKIKHMDVVSPDGIYGDLRDK